MNSLLTSSSSSTFSTAAAFWPMMMKTTTTTKLANTCQRNATLSGCLLPLWLALSLLLLAVASGSQPDQLTKRDFELIFDNFTCLSNGVTDLVRTLNCGLGKNSKRCTLQMEMSFKRDIVDFDLDIVILLPRPADDFVLLNLSRVSGCDFLANRNQVTLMHLARATLDRYSNYPNHCSLRRQTNYYIRGYRWDMDMLPTLTIETEVHIWLNYFVQQVKIIESFISCRLVIKQARKEQLTAAIFN